MRIHVQNSLQDDRFAITPAAVDEAARRAGASDIRASYGRTTDEFAAGLKDADLLLTSPGVLSQHLPLHANRLQLVFFTAAGLDKVMPFDWLPEGVRIWNNRGVHGDKAGEFAMMALGMLAMRIPDFIAAQNARKWEPIYTPTLRGRRAAVVGLGDIGGAVASQAKRAGMAVSGVSVSGKPHPACDRVVATTRLDEVLGESEYLVLCCPLTEQTRGLLSRTRLAALPPAAGIINLGRGALVDQDALCDLLDAGHLGGAVLDVFDPEPPVVDSRIWTTRNLVMTPHVSADDRDHYNTATLDILFANLRADAASLPPPTQVDLSRGY